jgi:hypothetical protein
LPPGELDKYVGRFDRGRLVNEIVSDASGFFLNLGRIACARAVADMPRSV